MTDQTPTRPGDLAPDEKICPFCAETIKAAAIRCRFCQSDLPAPDVEPAPTAQEPAATTPTPVIEPDVEPAIGPDVEPDQTPRARLRLPGAGASRGSRLVAILAVLCLVLAGLLWFLIDRSRNTELDTAPNGQVTANSFRNAAMGAASDAAAKALSYSHKTFDEDRAQARALMGSSLAKQYDEAMDQVKEQTATSKLTLKATVLAAGLLSAEEHRARVLLFVNTVTTREGSTNQQLDQNRVVMELTRKDGDWTVSKMDAF